MAEPSTASVRSFDDEALPHLDALYRVALRLTGDPAQAELLKDLKSRLTKRLAETNDPWLKEPSENE